MEKPNGQVVVRKGALVALAHVQAAFEGAVSEAGLTDENDVQAVVDNMHGRLSWIASWSSASGRPVSRARQTLLGGIDYEPGEPGAPGAPSRG